MGIGEIFVTSSPMSDEELRLAAAYIKNKWNIGSDINCEIVQKTTKGAALLVEDKIDEIYKVAWLKLNGIAFDEESINEKFSSACMFNIIGMHGANGVAGFLRTKNSGIYLGNAYVGLFDFDKEGSENFHHLGKESFGLQMQAAQRQTGTLKSV